MIAPLKLVLLVAAFICCALAALNIDGGPRIHLFPAGVALWLLAQFL